MKKFNTSQDKILDTSSRSLLLEELATRSRYYAGIVDLYLPDPDTVLEKLGLGLGSYRELLSDPHVGACIESRKAGVKSLNWEIIPTESAEQSQFIQKIFENLRIDQIVSEILDAPLFGFQPLEITWKNEDGFIIPSDIQGKPPEWFCFGNSNELRFKPQGSIDGEELPYGKFLLAVHDASYSNPYGSKLLSRCYWPVMFKKGGMKFWTMFVERFSGAFAIGKYPRGAQQEEIDSLANMLENLVQSAVAAIPDDSSVQILEAGGKGASSEVFKSFCEFFNAEISKAIVGQTMTTEVGANGSYAAGKVHEGVRQDIVASDSRLVTDVMNTLISLICEFNFNQTDSLPKFGFWSEKDVDKTQAERDATLLNTKGFRFTANYWKKTYGFEDEDFNIIDMNEQASMFSRTEPVYKDEADYLTDSMTVEDVENEMDGILKPVIELLEKSDSYDEVLKKLPEIYDGMDSDSLAVMLDRAMFLMSLYGRLKGERRDVR